MDGYIEARNEYEYLMLIHTVESKDTLKTYEELWNKIRNLVRSITNNAITMKFNLYQI